MQQFMKRFSTPILFGLAACALSLGGCATEDYVNQRVSDADARAQAGFNQQQGQLGQLDKNTQEAMARATAAGRLAEGKFLYAVVLSDDGVKFPPDGTKLSKEAQDRLMAFIEKMKSDNRNVYLEIQGHTDGTGTDAANLKLGEARAEAVRLFLNQNGVALNRMSTISYGKKSPVADNKTAKGRAQNRRVVLIVMN